MKFLKNYNEFIACYKIIEAVLYRSNYVLNEEFFYLIRKEPVDTTLLFCSEEARSEIINQLSINNNGRVSLAKRISNDNQEIDHVLNKIVKNNKIFTELEDIDSLCGIELDIFQFYTKMIVYKKRVYDGIEYYFDSVIRKELYQEPSPPQSATKTPETQPNRQSSSQDIEDYVEEYSKLFSYLNEFSNEGIEFNVFNEVNNTGEDRFLISHDGSGNIDRMIDLVNKEYQGELIDRFYKRKWQDHKGKRSADMFAKRELKCLNEFPSFLTEKHEDLFEYLQHYLDCRRFLTEEDMSWPEPIPPAAEQSSTIPQNDKITILFDSPETLDKLFGAMKPLFPKEREEDFSNLLKGKPLIEKLDFPLNQNQLSDLFKRLYETNRILNTKVQIKDWLFQNFTNKGECLGSSIYENLTKERARTAKSKRLYTDIFPPK